jgi:hypothetical protein
VEANVHDALGVDINQLDIAAVALNRRANQIKHALDALADIAGFRLGCIHEGSTPSSIRPESPSDNDLKNGVWGGLIRIRIGTVSYTSDPLCTVAANS